MSMSVLAPFSPLVETVAPGNYTAIVRGNDGTTGVGLVEVHTFSRCSGARRGERLYISMNFRHTDRAAASNIHPVAEAGLHDNDRR